MSKDRIKAAIQPDREGFPWIVLYDGLRWEGKIHAAITPENAQRLAKRLNELYLKANQPPKGRGKHTVVRQRRDEH